MRTLQCVHSTGRSILKSRDIAARSGVKDSAGGAMPAIVNVDGALLPPAEARISVLDRGFLYGDSVYEVVRTYGGVPFELPAHLRRLERSAERIGLSLPWEARRIAAEIDRTLDAARGED